MLNPFSQNPFL